MILKESLET